MSNNPYAALLDVGATHTRLAIVNLDNSDELPDKIVKVDTAPTEPITQLRELLQQSHRQISKAVIALPGTIHEKTLQKAPNLPGWNGVDFDALEDTFNMNIKLVHDVDAAGLGEAVFGAGQDSKVLAYFTISTGIGGARIVDHKIDSSAFGFEPSDQIIDWRSGAKLRTIESAQLVKDYQQPTGQITDHKLQDKIIKQLASGLYNATSLWSADTVVINGPPVFESDWFWSKLSAQLSGALDQLGSYKPQIVKSQLGDNAGLYGCLVLVNGDSS